MRRFSSIAMALVTAIAAATASAQPGPTLAPTGSATRVSLGFLADPTPLPLVMSVLPNGPAARAGLAVGDTIVKVEDVPASMGLIHQSSYGLKPGDRLRLTVHRGSREIVLTLIAQELIPAAAPTVVQREVVADRAGSYLMAACMSVKGPPRTAADSAAVACATRAPAMADRLRPARMLPTRAFVDAWGARFYAGVDSAGPTNAFTRIVVRSLDAGSIAARAGLLVGDVVIAAGEVRRGILEEIDSARAKGVAVELSIVRAGAAHRIRVGGKED